MRIYKSEILGATVDNDQKRIYFWGGIFSQWAECDIKDPILGVTFNTAEQGMMAYKAKTFNDDAAFDAILKTSNPREQKAIGRGVKGYVDAIWNERRLQVVTDLSYLKFTQNWTWRDLLLLTDGYELVEASPDDKIWGVGLGEDDPQILDKSQWQGQNLLGKALMAARHEILVGLTDKN